MALHDVSVRRYNARFDFKNQCVAQAAGPLKPLRPGPGPNARWEPAGLLDFDLDDAGYQWKTAEDPKRFDWEEGDLVFIPINTMHQHFNSDPDKPARFISASNRIYKTLGFGDIEEIEEAPPFDKKTGL